MRKRLVKIVGMMAAVLLVAGNVSDVAYAGHGHHSHTSGTSAVYAGCYLEGYCRESGSCDVDGVCQNGGYCTGISCYQDGSCALNGACQNEGHYTGTTHHVGIYVGKSVHHARGSHRSGRHH